MRLQKEGRKTYCWINWVNFIIKISGVHDRSVPSSLSRDLQKYIITSYNTLQREVWKSVWMHINTPKKCSDFEMQRSSLLSFPPRDLKGKKRSRNRDDKFKGKKTNKTKQKQTKNKPASPGRSSAQIVLGGCWATDVGDCAPHVLLSDKSLRMG